MGTQIDAEGAGMIGEVQNVPAVVETAAPVRSPGVRSRLAVPAVIAGAGDHAARRFLEFFAATIRNKNTRLAYYRAACHFFALVESTTSFNPWNRHLKRCEVSQNPRCWRTLNIMVIGDGH